jgi:hypothetical protein
VFITLPHVAPPYCGICRHKAHEVVNVELEPPTVLILRPVTLPQTRDSQLWDDENRSFPFTVTERITYAATEYIHIASCMSIPGHFWTVSCIKGLIYHSHFDLGDSYLRLQGPAPFVFRGPAGKPVQTVYHVYRKVADMRQMGNSLLSGNWRLQKSFG